MASGWSTPPSLFVEEIKDATIKRQRLIAIAMLREIDMRSPVDSGRFRANNMVSLDTPNYAVLAKTDPTGAATLQEGVRKINELTDYGVLTIQNNLPYAEIIEFGRYSGPTDKVTGEGYSRQAPQGVYAVSFHGVSEAYRYDV